MGSISTALAVVLALASFGCERDTSGLRPYPPITDADVFLDTFGDGVDYQAFLGSKFDAVQIDSNERAFGTTSLRVTVPAPGNPSETYAGGAFTTNEARDLSGYNALTFWAKASVASTLDVAGLGNDNTGTSQYTAEWRNIPLTTSWQRFVIPIPQPDRLSNEAGLFFFAEGDETGSGHTIWFDEVTFATVPNITLVEATMPTRTLTGFVGSSVEIDNTSATFNVNGQQQTIGHMPGYFDFSSSNDGVAVVRYGAIRIVGAGESQVTARLGTADVTGTVTVNASAPPPGPAPTPTHAPADVISLFSDAYNDVPVAQWSTTWDVADVTDLSIQGNAVKAYTSMLFAGIDWATSPDLTIDASQMNYFHIDVWVPSGDQFGVKLVDFGADGIYGFAPDSENELFYNASTTPAFVPGQWVSLDLDLSTFMNGPRGLFSREHMAQLIISGGPTTAYIDNVYFHK
jgi:hypothetical protein